jgi:hypothetical protein
MAADACNAAGSKITSATLLGPAQVQHVFFVQLSALRAAGGCMPLATYNRWYLAPTVVMLQPMYRQART